LEGKAHESEGFQSIKNFKGWLEFATQDIEDEMFNKEDKT